LELFSGFFVPIISVLARYLIMPNLLLIALTTIVCASNTFFAQNLVPNPSFENLTQCPNSFSQLSYAAPWYSPTYGTPDIFNACAGPGVDIWTSLACMPFNTMGFQYSNSGQGHAGLYTYDDDYREYIQAPLISPMQAGTTYLVSFYISQADHQPHNAAGPIGAYFSNAPIVDYATNAQLLSTPQVIGPAPILDTSSWYLVESLYVASGGEAYITIGNFNTNSNTSFAPGSAQWYSSYFYIDDVSVVEYNDPADPPMDTDTVVQTLSYIEMPNIFTPNEDGINDAFVPFNSQGINHTNLIITNRWGELVYQGDILINGWDGKWEGKLCSPGTYFWKMIYTKSDGTEETQHGFVQLMK